jgi:uncharacterized membrane protein
VGSVGDQRGRVEPLSGARSYLRELLPMISQVVEHKDVVTAILGAAAALAGLTLVFLGLVVTAYQAASGSGSESVRDRYRGFAALILIAFVASIACVALATAWLVDLHDNQVLYVAVVVTFFASLAILLVATVIVVQRLLARHS